MSTTPRTGGVRPALSLAAGLVEMGRLCEEAPSDQPDSGALVAAARTVVERVMPFPQFAAAFSEVGGACPITEGAYYRALEVAVQLAAACGLSARIPSVVVPIGEVSVTN